MKELAPMFGAERTDAMMLYCNEEKNEYNDLRFSEFSSGWFLFFMIFFIRVKKFYISLAFFYPQRMSDLFSC